jgi:hypothetical protein
MINFHDRVATNQPKIGRDLTDKILKGNAGAIATLMNRFYGIDNNIALGLVGTLKNDPVIILDSIYKISEQLGLDPELNVTIAEIVFEQFNSSSINGNEMSGTAIRNIKKLISHFFPQFPIEIIDEALKMVMKMEIKPLIKICKDSKISLDSFNILNLYKENNSKNMKTIFCKMLKNCFHPSISDLFSILKQLRHYDSNIDYKKLAEILIEPKEMYLLRYIWAMSIDEDLEYISTVLNMINDIVDLNLEKGILFVQDINDKIKSEAQQFKQFFLGLSTFSISNPLRGIITSKYSFFDTKWQNFIDYIYYTLSDFNDTFIKIVLSNLGLEKNIKVVFEFHDILMNNGKSISVIPELLGIIPEYNVILQAAICLSIEISKYSRESTKKLTKQKLSEDDENDEFVFDTFEYIDWDTKKIVRYLRVLCDYEVIDSITLPRCLQKIPSINTFWKGSNSKMKNNSALQLNLLKQIFDESSNILVLKLTL